MADCVQLVKQDVHRPIQKKRHEDESEKSVCTQLKEDLLLLFTLTYLVE